MKPKHIQGIMFFIQLKVSIDLNAIVMLSGKKKQLLLFLKEWAESLNLIYFCYGVDHANGSFLP
jgi:hypothetical protein